MGAAYGELVYQPVEPLVKAVKLDQQWNMFSPRPPVRDGWFVLHATLADGQQEDLLRPGRDDGLWARPASIKNTYINQRWRKYLEWTMKQGPRYGPELARYYAERWNGAHEASRQVTRLDVVFMLEPTRPNFQAVPVRKKGLATWESGR